MIIKDIRVGMVAQNSIADPDSMSGTPLCIFNALKKSGLTIVDLSPKVNYYQNESIFYKAVRKLRGFILKYSFLEDSYYYTIYDAIKVSNKTQQLIDSSNVDIIFGVCISNVLYNLRDDRPILYASDTTAKLINSTYELWKNRSKNYHKATDEIESKSINKCTYFLAAAGSTTESAINDYGLSPDKVKLIEFGANVLPELPITEISHPSKSRLELSVVAADPIRKRLDFCIEVAECLKNRGWNVVLNYIGERNKAADANSLVNYCGRLQLSNEADRKIHQDILRRSHWMLLPSKAEAFGIAPCEAAHFGRPSIVSDVEGLPTVVKHNETGIVMSVDSTVENYATCIAENSLNTEKYIAFSRAALERAHNTLSWSVWAEKVKELINEVTANKQKNLSS